MFTIHKLWSQQTSQFSNKTPELNCIFIKKLKTLLTDSKHLQLKIENNNNDVNIIKDDYLQR